MTDVCVHRGFFLLPSCTYLRKGFEHEHASNPIQRLKMKLIKNTLLVLWMRMWMVRTDLLYLWLCKVCSYMWQPSDMMEAAGIMR